MSNTRCYEWVERGILRSRHEWEHGWDGKATHCTRCGYLYPEFDIRSTNILERYMELEDTTQ